MIVSLLFIILQLICLVVQIGSFVYAVKTKNDLFDVLYGFTIWGVIPVLAFGQLAKYFGGY